MARECLIAKARLGTRLRSESECACKIKPQTLELRNRSSMLVSLFRRPWCGLNLKGVDSTLRIPTGSPGPQLVLMRD